MLDNFKKVNHNKKVNKKQVLNIMKRQRYIKKDSTIQLTNAGILLPNGNFCPNEEIQLEDGSFLRTCLWYGDKLIAMGFVRKYD